MKPRLFADLARCRLRTPPPGPPTAELQQAKVDFIEALISRNYRAAQAANAVIARYARPEPPLPVAERERRARRLSALVTYVCALRELREEEARGLVRPPPTPEQLVVSKAVLNRWLAGYDGVGQEEGPQP
jgi:hypothetical protein